MYMGEKHYIEHSNAYETSITSLMQMYLIMDCKRDEKLEGLMDPESTYANMNFYMKNKVHISVEKANDNLLLIVNWITVVVFQYILNR